MFSQIRKLTRDPAFWLTLILLGCGWFSTSVADNASLGNAALLIGIGCGLGWVINWIVTRRTLDQSLARLVVTGETIVAQSSRTLANALTALAQGNLAARVQIDAQPLALTGSSEIDQIAKVFNNVIVQIHESAKEFNAVTNEPNQRLFYVGSDSYLDGCSCGEILGQLLNGQGEVAVIIGSSLLTSQRLRLKGFESTLQEKFPNVRIIQIGETQNNIENCYTLTVEFVKHYPQLAGIYVTEGGCPFAAARALVETGASKRN